MKYEFFIKILKGKNNFDATEQAYLKRFEEDKIIKIIDNTIVLNSIYKVGKIELKKNYAKFIDVSANENLNLNIEFEDLNGASDGDEVLIKRTINPKAKSKAKVVEILKDGGNTKLIYVKDKKIFTIKENIEISLDIKLPSYNDYDVFKISNIGGKKVELIGNIEDADIDERLSLIAYNEEFRLEKYFVDETFSMDGDENRVDLTHLDFCTIDPATAKDHDDAIYYDNVTSTIYVAIADVSYFVKEGTTLDMLAYERSSSLYFPNRVLPMLPFELSEELCSLKPNVKRYAYVFEIKLDLQNVCVVHSKLYEAIIESKKKYSYGKIDRVLQNHFDQHDSIDKTIFNSIIDFYEVSRAFRAKRMQSGYDFRTSEYRQKLDRNLELSDVECEESTPSHQLIEEAMLLANVEAAKKLSGFGIFRTHPEPTNNAIIELVNQANMLGLKVKLKNDIHETIADIQKKASYVNLSVEVDKLIIESQQLAVYSSKNFGHFGLGFKEYSHFTSPIRRYSDLVLHRILKSKKVPKDIDAICDVISSKERTIDNIVYDLTARKYARWAKKNIGCELKAAVVDIQKGIIEVYDKKILGLRAVVSNFKNDKLFSKCKVKIIDSDIVTKIIKVEIKY